MPGAASASTTASSSSAPLIAGDPIVLPHVPETGFALFRRDVDALSGVARTAICTSVLDAFGVADPKNEVWVFIDPHPDDSALAFGLLMQAARDAGIRMAVITVSDGQLGYRPGPSDGGRSWTPESVQGIRESLPARRQGEAKTSYGMLGVNAADITFLGFPDGSVGRYSGMAVAQAGEVNAIQGLNGVLAHLVFHLRRLGASTGGEEARQLRVFAPTDQDIHPDHKATYRDAVFACMCASGATWPELGRSLPIRPRMYEGIVYADLARTPTIDVCTRDPQHVAQWFQAIRAHESQGQIGGLIARLEGSARPDGTYDQFVGEVAVAHANFSDIRQRFFDVS